MTTCNYSREPHPVFTDADAGWRAKHKAGDWRTFTGGPFCLECRKVWPCIPAFEHEAAWHTRDGETEEQRTARFRSVMPNESTLFSPYVYPLVQARKARERGDEESAIRWEKVGRQDFYGRTT